MLCPKIFPCLMIFENFTTPSVYSTLKRSAKNFGHEWKKPSFNVPLLRVPDTLVTCTRLPTTILGKRKIKYKSF